MRVSCLLSLLRLVWEKHRVTHGLHSLVEGLCASEFHALPRFGRVQALMKCPYHLLLPESLVHPDKVFSA